MPGEGFLLRKLGHVEGLLLDVATLLSAWPVGAEVQLLMTSSFGAQTAAGLHIWRCVAMGDASACVWTRQHTQMMCK